MSYLWDMTARRRELYGRDQVCDALPNHILPRRKPMEMSIVTIAGCDCSLQKNPELVKYYK
jgi:hypothetical protein